MISVPMRYSILIPCLHLLRAVVEQMKAESHRVLLSSLVPTYCPSLRHS